MYSVGIVGATGAVGQEILKLLDVEHDTTTNTNKNKNIQSLPVSSVHLFGSSRSQGKTMTTTKFGTLTIQLFDCQTVCETCQIVFLAVSGSFALEHAPKMAQSGTIVIDNSVRTKEIKLQCVCCVCDLLYCLSQQLIFTN